MNSLYETSTVFSFEEYKKFVDATSSRKTNNILMAIVSVALVAMGILEKSILLIVLAAAYPLLMSFSQKKGLERTYKKNPAMHNSRVDYRFYETCFVKVFGESEDQYDYEKLYKVIETETNFYLMISKTQGFVLIKANMPEGMEDFVRSIKK